jgi:hypothetical protein
MDERVRPLTAEEALALVREVGSVGSITQLSTLLRWDRSRTSRAVAVWEREGEILRKPGPGGAAVIIAVMAVQVSDEPPAHPAAQPARPCAHPAHPSFGWLRSAFRHGVTAWCRVVFGIVLGASSIMLFGASVFLNAAFWPGLAQSENAKAVLAVFGFTVEVCNFTIPSAASLVAMPRSFRRGLWVLLALTMVTAGIAGSSFVRSNLGAAEVSRDQVNKERDRLQGIIRSVAVPVSDAAVADARSRVRSAETLRKSTCAPTKSLDLDECSKAKAEVLKAEAALATENTKHTAAVAAAEEQRRKDLAGARSALDRLPMISADKNVVLAGVASIVPWASAALVDGLVAGLWVALLLLGPCLLLRLSLMLLVLARTEGPA